MNNSSLMKTILCGVALSLLSLGIAAPSQAETADSFLANKRSREQQTQACQHTVRSASGLPSQTST